MISQSGVCGVGVPGSKSRPTFLSSIKKCIAPTAYRPSHHSVPPLPHHHPSPQQLRHSMDSQQIEEEVEKNRRRFFRARSNTGALVAREATTTESLTVSGSVPGIRSRSLSFGGRGSLSSSVGGGIPSARPLPACD